MSTPLPGPLAANPRLNRWIAFPAPGQIAVFTGRVEFGQGVLTAMAQIAAEELDVALSRISITGGDTALTPNEGYTAGSQSMQFGGVALRQACAEVRALFLAAAAKHIGCEAHELSVRDGGMFRNGAPTGEDYWTLTDAVDIAVEASGAGRCKAPADFTIIGTSSPRLDLPGKIFGAAAFIHDFKLVGMKHARVVRQPNRGASIDAINKTAIKRAAKAPVQIVENGNFIAVVGDDEPAVEAAAVAADTAVTWRNVEPPTATQQEAAWLVQRPAIDRMLGADERTDPLGRQRFEATYSKPYLAHASIAPPCGLALYNNGKLTVWTQCQGVFPLRAALARMLKLEPATIIVHYLQGAGCYGHNGADDAAADAAIIAIQMPGVPVRVRWRREEEFIYEPKGSAMVVKVRVLTDGDGKPADWTTEIWSGTHQGRPGGGAPLLPDGALPDPLSWPPPSDVPEASGGGATRNAEPLYAIARKRIMHHLVTETPVRVSSLRGLGAMANVFAIECAVDELAARAGQDPVAYRLSITDDARGRTVIEKAASMANWQPGAPAGSGTGRGFAFARYKNRAGYAAIVVELTVDKDIRLGHIWCAVDAGLLINPDGVLNQVEGGIIQSASWVLKEQVRLDAGVASLDWETYPVLKFSEVPEIDIELIKTPAEAPLGIGEVSAGPTAAAIGNAVSHALGARLRDLPLTRDRVMSALLQA